VHALSNGRWIEIGASISDEKGCANYTIWGDMVNLPVHGYAFLAVRGPFGPPAYTYEGITNNAPAGVGEFSLGTYVVNCIPGDLLCP
jgi:hypothetical protein